MAFATYEDWEKYWKSHHLLSTETLNHRLPLLDEIIALTVTELSYQKNYRKE